MKNYVLLLIICSLWLVPFAGAADFHKGSLFKIKLVADYQKVECEYALPANYMCKINGNELEDRQARKQLMLFYQQLHLHHGIKAEEMVARLQNKGYKNIQFLDVRWLDDHGRLFTWRWEKDNH
ncbi:hypothetical protein B0I26_103201 [Anoxybacillus vitaminiphilus]|uniref:YusW-like protein n=1 Tax=Paranoxybacillus vitaminiphilus TaxID=581036 RepID=A0A327YM14_9BACL|nr:hypothetical protein [Anoxybacillus vitaminiphilus]RAK21246.1 hypothetical protein B0I26_103201 [Anoxybacillus vitaminiphilus]